MNLIIPSNRLKASQKTQENFLGIVNSTQGSPKVSEIGKTIDRPPKHMTNIMKTINSD